MPHCVSCYKRARYNRWPTKWMIRPSWSNNSKSRRGPCKMKYGRSRRNCVSKPYGTANAYNCKNKWKNYRPDNVSCKGTNARHENDSWPCKRGTKNSLYGAMMMLVSMMTCMVEIQAVAGKMQMVQVLRMALLPRRHRHPMAPLRLLRRRLPLLATRHVKARTIILVRQQIPKMLGNRKALDRLDGEAAPGEEVADQDRVAGRRKVWDLDILLPPRQIQGLRMLLLLLLRRQRPRILLLLPTPTTRVKLRRQTPTASARRLPRQHKILTYLRTAVRKLSMMINEDYAICK
mmetsp:Transcript_16617/g.33510  ORF Transcript_16617/g.33510 Transcript_16617/m.33510 type:complete len:290 (+) Transcript_16617:231-1100(+)